MIFSEARWLEDRLAAWRTAGAIDARQASAIRAFERGKPGLGAFMLLAGIGGACMAAGVILLVAYNWDTIPPGLKIAGFLTLLLAAAEGARWTSRSRPVLSAAPQLFWLMFPLAGIGLWGQIFQLSGDPLRPLLVWLALGLPVVLLGRQPAVAFVHVAGIAAACFVGALSDGTDLSLRVAPQGWFWWWRGGEGDGAWTPGLAPALTGLAVLWFAAWYEARVLLEPRFRVWLILAELAFLWSLTLAATPFECKHLADQCLVAGLLSALFWGAARSTGLDHGDWEIWATELTALMLYALTFVWHADWGSLAPTFELGSGWFLGGLGLMTVLLTGGADLSRMTSTRGASWFLKGVVLAPPVLALLLLNETTRLAVAGGANLVLVAFGVWLITEGMHRGEEAKINAGAGAIAVLILTRLFDVFQTLLVGGLGFILTGAGLIGLAWIFNQGRRRLLAQAARK